MTLVDTNVLLHVLTNDPDWGGWSSEQLERTAAGGALMINDIIYAELSVGFTTIERVDAAIRSLGLAHHPMPRAALFLAGKAFKQYRAAGGPRTVILPDLFVGAHAAVAGVAILTRDAKRYRAYFPAIELITP